MSDKASIFRVFSECQSFLSFKGLTYFITIPKWLDEEIEDNEGEGFKIRKVNVLKSSDMYRCALLNERCINIKNKSNFKNFFDFDEYRENKIGLDSLTDERLKLHFFEPDEPDCPYFNY